MQRGRRTTRAALARTGSVAGCLLNALLTRHPPHPVWSNLWTLCAVSNNPDAVPVVCVVMDVWLHEQFCCCVVASPPPGVWVRAGCGLHPVCLCSVATAAAYSIVSTVCVYYWRVLHWAQSHYRPFVPALCAASTTCPLGRECHTPMLAQSL